MQPLPDMKELMKLAQSPAGQKLLALLQSSSVDMEKLARDASQGNWDAAKMQFGTALDSPEAQALLKQLEKQL